VIKKRVSWVTVGVILIIVLFLVGLAVNKLTNEQRVTEFSVTDSKGQRLTKETLEKEVGQIVKTVGLLKSIDGRMAITNASSDLTIYIIEEKKGFVSTPLDSVVEVSGRLQHSQGGTGVNGNAFVSGSGTATKPYFFVDCNEPTSSFQVISR